MRIAEEAGDVDEQVLGQQVELARIAPQDPDIPIHRRDPGQRHAPPDAPLKGARLVEPEIVGGFRAQKVDDLLQPGLCLIRRVETARCPSLTVFDQRFRHLRLRKDKINRARRNRAARHAVIGGLTRLLRDHQPAFLLHGLQPKAAIGARSRQDHTDGARTAVLRQRIQQKVEWQPRPVARLRLREVQRAVADGQIGSRGNHIDVIGLDRHAVGCLLHRHRGMAGQQIDHHAFVCGVEMLDQDESHAVAGCQRAQESPTRLKAARRCTYPNNRERPLPARGVRRGQGAPARSRSGRFGLLRATVCHSSTVSDECADRLGTRPNFLSQIVRSGDSTASASRPRVAGRIWRVYPKEGGRASASWSPSRNWPAWTCCAPTRPAP